MTVSMANIYIFDNYHKDKCFFYGGQLTDLRLVKCEQWDYVG